MNVFTDFDAFVVFLEEQESNFVIGLLPEVEGYLSAICPDDDLVEDFSRPVAVEAVASLITAIKAGDYGMEFPMRVSANFVCESVDEAFAYVDDELVSYREFLTACDGRLF